MEEKQVVSVPIAVSQNYRYYMVNKPACRMKQKFKQIPRSIPYCTLGNTIIWLDLLANERNLYFTAEMVSSEKLIIFNTAVDCGDFLKSCSQQISSSSIETNYSIIISGIYATDTKLINQLLLYSLVNQICLILQEEQYDNIRELFSFDQNVNVIYNDDPDGVMYLLCKDYLNFEIFVRYNCELYLTKNSCLNDYTQSTIGRSNDVNASDEKHSHNQVCFLTEGTCSVPITQTNQVNNKNFNVTTNTTLSSKNDTRRPDQERLPFKINSPQTYTRSSSYENINLSEIPIVPNSHDAIDRRVSNRLDGLIKVCIFSFHATRMLKYEII